MRWCRIESDDHPDALLFNAQRRDLGKADRFDPAHAASQLAVAAPMLEHHTHSGMQSHRISRQHIDLDLQRARVANLDDRLAGGYRAFALACNFQHATVHRRAQHHRLGATTASGVLQCSAGDLQLMPRRGDRKVGRLQLGSTARGIAGGALFGSLRGIAG